MRRLTGMLVALVILGTVRDAAADPVRASIKVGINLTRVAVTGSGRFDTESRAGVTAGLAFEAPLSSTIAIRPEVLFAKRKFHSDDLPLPLDVTANTLEIPVFLQRAAGRVRLFAGPQLALISKVTQRFGTVRSDISDDIRNVDFGIAAGLSVDVPLGSRALILEGRGTLGLSNVSEGAGTTMKSRAFAALLGFRF